MDTFSQVVFALAALLGVAGGAAGLFVIRHEYQRYQAEMSQLHSQIRADLDELRRDYLDLLKQRAGVGGK